MRAIYTANNISQKLVVGQKARPRIRSREVLIKVHSSSINPIDWKFPSKIVWFYPFSIVLGRDVVGEVVQVGKGVSKYKLGDWVFGCKAFAIKGAYADFYSIHESQIAHAPKNLDSDLLGAAPLVCLTALQAIQSAKLSKGDRILIIGGAGGVGHVGIQIAKSFGLIVDAVCSGRNKNFVLEQGADRVIDYTKEDWTKQSLKYDFIFDTVGSSSYGEAKRLLNNRHLYVTTLDTFNSYFERIKSETFGRFWSRFNTGGFHFLKPNTQDLETISKMLSEGVLNIHIDKRFSFDQIEEAFAVSKMGRTVGKNILLFDLDK